METSGARSHGRDSGTARAASGLESSDENLVEIWLRWDPTRWMAGVFGGIFAGTVMALVAMVLSRVGGREIWLPLKLAAVPVLGPSATEFGMNAVAIGTGVSVHGALCAVLGGVFAHFTGRNQLVFLAGVGFTWGVFGWIFINNLFVNAFRGVLALHIPPGPSFLVHAVFGVSLVSVAFFDRLLRAR